MPPGKRGAAIGIWGRITGLGVAAGPVAGGAVVQGLSWQWIFWINMPAGLLIAGFVGWERRSRYPMLPLGYWLGVRGSGRADAAGLPPMIYQAQLRAEHAASLLLHTDEPVTTIGRAVSRPDQRCSPALRRHYGFSATTYRKRFAAGAAHLQSRHSRHLR